MVTFIDLFAGIGGFRLGLERAGYRCSSSCEIDPACQKVYAANFGELPQGDIAQIDIDAIPPFEVLCAGFPCQAFSISGKRKGFQDARGTLFFQVCKIIKAHRPKAIILENVKHLLHHDRGKTLKTMIAALEELGYFTSYAILNAKDFQLPQNRERIIIVASLKKQIEDLFPRLQNAKQTTPKLENYLCSTGDFSYLEPQEYTLLDNPKQQPSGLIFAGYLNGKTPRKKGVRADTLHLSRAHRQPNRIYSAAGIHPTLPSQETSGRFFIYLPQENRVRKLTIPECYRLMGFPENFIRHPSKAACYRQIGNSVCVPQMQQIATFLCELLRENVL